MVHNLDNIKHVVILLSAAMLVVTTFRWFKLSPVLGYFVAGGLISKYQGVCVSNELNTFAELGVVFLLFIIGLEFTFERLMKMKKYVFGFGTLQVFITSVFIGGFVFYFLKYDMRVSSIIGIALSMSSTAIVTQLLKENGTQDTDQGKVAISNLLMQDFIVVPLLVLVPLMANNELSNIMFLKAITNAIIKAICALVAIFIVGRTLFRPMFNLISKFESEELFICATMLVVLGAAYITEKMELSMALGAFVSGLMVAETKYRNEVERVVFPFKALLLGLFFMNVGMSIDVRGLLMNIKIISLFVFVIIIIKAIVLFCLARIFKMNFVSSIKIGLLLSQGSEFAFILFNLASQQDIISNELAQIIMMAVTTTMAITPLLFNVTSFFIKRHRKKKLQYADANELGCFDMENHVLIVGFNRIGSILVNILKREKINHAIVDINKEVIKSAKKSGHKIYLGDACDLGLLSNLKVDKTLCVVILINNAITMRACLNKIATNFPGVRVKICVADILDWELKYGQNSNISFFCTKDEVGISLSRDILNNIGFDHTSIKEIISSFRLYIEENNNKM